MNRSHFAHVGLLLLLLGGVASTGCNSGSKTTQTAAEERTSRIGAADATIREFTAKDPGLKAFFDGSNGYAIFPTVGKGGVVVSGAHGDGVVYEKGKPIGYTALTQGGIGLTLGGQAYSEVIFFKEAADLAIFKRGNMELSAQASAVAVTAGASADADYSQGVAIFTLPKGGLMFEASVGGQGFSYEPLP